MASARRTTRLMAGLAVAVVVFVAVEVGLRMLAPDDGPRLVSPLAFQRHDEPLSSPGPTAGSVLFGGPNIVTAKEPAGLRIFFFGGSATEGYHMTPYSAFAGWYQRILRNLLPSGSVEVINLGAGGEASRQVAELVSAAASQQKANLFVVYSGNNEYYELRALKESLPGFDARTELARRRLSGLHVYRFLRRMLMPEAPSLDPSTTLRPVDSIDAEINEDERELGVLLYAEHLRSMVEAASGAEVPLLLSTVADHTRSYAFHGSPPALSPGVEEGLRSLDEAGRSRNAAAVESTLGTLEPNLMTQADHHAVARILDRDQQWDRAKIHFEAAEYLDPRPRRSSRPMRDALRAVADETSTPICDVDAALAAQAIGGVSGDDFFFDPCHPNALGHRRIAEILVRCTLEQGLIDAPQTGLDSLLRSLPLEGADPMRLDHYTGRRAQLRENRGMSQAEIETAIRAHDDGTPSGAAIAGHQAALFGLYRGALAWYDLAASSGEETSGLWISRGLMHQHLHDMTSARAAMDQAVLMAPDDAEIRQFRAVLGNG